MKKSAFLLLLVISVATYAQEKGQEVFSLTSRFERIEIIRMHPGTDLLEGLNSLISEKKIKNAVILTGIGSVTDYHFHVVSDKNLPPSEEFPEASVAMDMIAMQGYILAGRVHAHITLSDANSVVGGHLEPGTKALTFFILTIGILPDNLDISYLDNYRWRD
jgi:predicted DNA-binding protein with PD1-like motif